MSRDELAACRRMRACLAAITDLDPEGVALRLAEMDRTIAMLERLLGTEPEAAEARPQGRIEVIPIGSAIRAA